jgi:DNA-binding transcriptional MocR family regulator
LLLLAASGDAAVKVPASALKRHRIAACYLMTNFQNPLGSSMPDEKNADLVKLLARNSVPIIEDYGYA